jgi:hypothetical protein
MKIQNNVNQIRKCTVVGNMGGGGARGFGQILLRGIFGVVRKYGGGAGGSPFFKLDSFL